MVLNTIRFHYSNNSLRINNLKSDLGHFFHSKCQITAIFTFVNISTDGYYVALNASNVRYSTFNKHLKYHKKNKQINKFNNK